MPDLKSTVGKHLTLDERQEIMECLDKGVSFKDISRRVGKDPRTISREVKRHISVQPLSVSRTKADGTPLTTPCPQLMKSPFVCNPCKKRRGNCSFQKQLYIAKNAQKEYETTLVESREGIPLEKEEFWESDKIIAEGIKRGQHLYHIMESNDVAFSKSSAYRHLHRGYLSVSKTDFPRVVKFKKRRGRRPDAVPKALRECKEINFTLPLSFCPMSASAKVYVRLCTCDFRLLALGQKFFGNCKVYFLTFP